LGTFIHDLRHKDIVVDDLQMESSMVADNEKRSFIMSLASKTKMDRGELAAVINEVAPEVHLDIF
jgi:hypothetical protein